MRASPAGLCLLPLLLPGAQGYIWAWLYSLPYHPLDQAALPRSTGPQANSKASMATARCSQDRHCAPGLFCDRHSRLCLPWRQEGQYCRHDAHCAWGLSCMFGQCHRTMPAGPEVPSQAAPRACCRQDKDCDRASCCTRHHAGSGRALPRVPGGLAFSLHQVCPCWCAGRKRSTSGRVKVTGDV